MEVLFHLIFQLVKVGILASIYALVLIGIFSIVKNFSPSGMVIRVTSNKKKYWLSFSLFIYVGLFIYSCTYWGNHGLGDSARIPIGNWESIENINWNGYGYLKNRKTREGYEITTTKFKVDNHILAGNLDGDFYIYKNKYFTFNLKTKAITEFSTEAEFNANAEIHNSPNSNQLQDFTQNYHDHWSGLRFFLLP